jgi:hypothetical protein
MDRLMLVKEFLKTVYKQIVCTFTTRKKNMSNRGPEDWIYDIIPAKQVEEIESKAKSLQHNLDNGLNVVLSATNDSAIRLCKAYYDSTQGNMQAWLHIMGFLDALIGTIEEHLEEEGIDPYAK